MKKETGKQTRMPDWRRLGLGLGVGLLGMLTAAALSAWALERELVGMEWINYLAALNLLVPSYLGAKMAGVSPRQWPAAAALWAGFWMSLAVLHIACFGGGFHGSGVTALVLLGGIGTALIQNGGGKRRRSPARKRRNR